MNSLGVPALPPHIFGYRHYAREPLYLVEDRLYRVPAVEAEHTLFHVSLNEDETRPPAYPLGGHNYYNGRDLEKLTRRISWLGMATPSKEGWEERYASYAATRQ